MLVSYLLIITYSLPEGSTYTYVEEYRTETHDTTILYAISDIMTENEDRIFVHTGDKVYVIERSSDRVYVRKDKSEEKQWVKSEFLMDEVHYKEFIQKKISEIVEVTYTIGM